ncbi:MAG: hypothetical protein AAGD34_05130 [Pseudomonadota bacterium]
MTHHARTIDKTLSDIVPLRTGYDDDGKVIFLPTHWVDEAPLEPRCTVTRCPYCDHQTLQPEVDGFAYQAYMG